MKPESIQGWMRLHNRATFAQDFMQDRFGKPWNVRDYQRDSMESYAQRKVHCDGRDVGKTTEIELLVLWASVACPNQEMMIATQSENHLYPLMRRIIARIESMPHFATNIAGIKRSPSWHIRFNNGFVLWGRITGPRGTNFQGMHVDWQLIDEAQEMSETGWGELYQALNGGGKRWIYGVPNGRRDSFYRMTLDSEADQYNWPSTLNPEYDDTKDQELIRLYGGKQSPGYIHRVLGQHGKPAYGVFDADAYANCVDDTLPLNEIHLQEDDDFIVPAEIPSGTYYLGCDLGYARDPSEFVIYHAEGPYLHHVLRVHLDGVNYARQEDILIELDHAYNFQGVGIDSGNAGRAVAHRLMQQSEDWCQKIRAYEFGSTIDLAPLPDESIQRRRTKEFMTELLQTRIQEGTIRFPNSPQRQSQYLAHSYSVSDHGNILYEKGNDHIIDADRCALLRWYQDTQYEDCDIDHVPLGAKISSFGLT